ncbi:MAG TPA: Zn-dependent hydrolase [Bacteroidales bacterium]|nr:MAG: Zn-dependent hydrolase [Bacteroidetes bacterium GWE2_42_24]OFY28709.1 MAG: Zn-dependent hydrolase [Bacteroidetes bacterium GWF2_43_11]HBZ66193.1 Zn-dependent hydrolase [Bacteroidales bacterium]
MRLNFKLTMVLLALAAMTACKQKPASTSEKTSVQMKLDEYARFELTADMSQLSEKEKQMIPLLIDVADIMDGLFWKQSYGDKEALLSSIADSATREFVKINYGPWERLNGNISFVEGIGEKPAGARFYPVDMTKEEFEKLDNADKTGLYTILTRNANGGLEVVPYSVAYKEELGKAAHLIRKAAELAEEPRLKKYLELRADALLSNDYYASDFAWMEMKDNGIDFVVGPIENYEDALYGYKAAFESFVLVKDKEWTARVGHYASLLPQLQKSLPVPDKYKKETPGSDSDLGVYEAIFYAGDCNSGSKTIAINLPNDPKIHVEKGSRKLQLKNVMRAKFEKILVPIAELLVNPEQRKHIKFDAFFENVMFHETGHGLGVTRTLDGKLTTREALKEAYSSIEEGKADILGLYLVNQLNEMGELKDKDMMDNYVTFMAGIFRSVRFGASSAHGKANMITFYYFMEHGAISYDAANGYYTVNYEKMKQAVSDLSGLILTMQGDGNYDAAVKLIAEKGTVGEGLQKDLDRIGSAGIPRDIVFAQGKGILGY